ncbi:MAG: TetR/AcrR family transcriptional regulator [Syntrophobacterales bacterium]|nr:TetR/AcrR family transcriptional regulator [Syntrophobacterales bacterium]
MRPRPRTRDFILDAAELLVLDVGAGHMTLDAVAERAGVSKGGLLYHFHSKEALLEAMVSRLLQRFAARQAETTLNLPEGPKRGLRAYLMASLTDAEATQRLSASLLAAGANNPKLLEPVREYFREWFARLGTFGLEFERAAVISLAVDGLWLLELLQLSPLDQRQRAGVSRELFRLVDGSA